MRKSLVLVLGLFVQSGLVFAQECEPPPDWVYVGSKVNKVDLALRIAVPVAIGADLITTERALQRPGVVEVNPIQQNRAVRAATHALAAYGVDWAARRWEKKGQRRKARILRVAITAGYTALAIRNSRVK